jgi:hypothetical protein
VSTCNLLAGSGKLQGTNPSHCNMQAKQVAAAAAAVLRTMAKASTQKLSQVTHHHPAVGQSFLCFYAAAGAIVVLIRMQ